LILLYTWRFLSRGTGVLSFLVTRCSLILFLALLMLSGAGCYHRVVSSKGLGGMGTTVEDPYRSDTAADRAVDRMTGHEAKQPGYQIESPGSSSGTTVPATTGATYRTNGGMNGH
jgi:hypothetical protein